MTEASQIKLQNTIDRIAGAILAGINLNPPPTRKIKWPCIICNRPVNSNQKAIECDTCHKWCHMNCDGRLTIKDYEFYENNQNNPEVEWHCLYCNLKEKHDIFPFMLSDTAELMKINNCDTMEFCKTIPSLEIIQETSSFEKYSIPDIDSTFPNLLTSKYHSVDEVQNLKVEKDFNIFHSNVDGLESKFENLHSFINGSKSAMDIIALTETSENDANSFLKNVKIEGYHDPFSTPTLSRKGGVALYVNSEFKVLERTDLNVQTKDYESIWIEIKNEKSKNIVCGCVYRHPRYFLTDFMDYMDSTLHKITKEGKEIYLCGDFNIDFLKTDVEKSSTDFYALLSSNGLLPYIIHPSRVVENKAPSLIDNIFSNNVSDIVLSGNIYMQLSEHFSQFASVKRDKIDIHKIVMYGRDWSKYEEEKFRDEISNHDWQNDSEDPNVLMTDFYSKLGGSSDKHVKVKKLSPKEIKLKLNPWITPEIRKMLQIRDRLFARKKREPYNERVDQIYKIARNRVSRKIQKSKKDHQEAYFNEHQTDIKKTWEGLRKLVNVKKSVRFSISQLNVNGKIVDEPAEIAEKLNKFFVNVGPETERSVPKVPHASPQKFLKNRNQFELIIGHISNEEVLTIINSLPNKSTGPNSIPLRLLKDVADLIISPLCNIINLSFSSGIFPDSLKVSKVVAIHKGGSTQEVNNFRPISLLSIFDKIIEKLMHKRLYEFFEEHDILYKLQFGFRKKMSTNHSLMEITEEIKESIDNGKFGCGIFIDLKKAFDTVNHQILLTKLEHYGIRGAILKWFESYLSNRKQYVFHNGVASDMEAISCGVPQGSVLGPLLFLIYVNDLPNISDKLKFFLFADDTNIYYESDDLIELEKTVNQELRKLSQWLNINRLALNIGKTNFVIFRANKKIYHTVTLILNRKAIEQKDHVKYLGILMDEHLNWKKQIANVAKKISRGIGILAKLRSYLDPKLLTTIYYCIVYSHLSYGVEAWGSACASDLDKILILQKKAVRILTGNRYFQIYGETTPLPPSEPLFKTLETLKFEDIFKVSIAKFVYSTLAHETPAVFWDWFTYSHLIHNHATTSSTQINRTHFFDAGTVVNTRYLFTKQSHLVNYGGKMIQVYGPILWNSLPKEIHESCSLPTFKDNVKRYFLSKYDL